MKAADVQEAIYSVMSNDAALVAELSSAWGMTAIFSDTPQENAGDSSFYPFISFGPSIDTPFDTKGSLGSESLLQINVWSRSGGYLQVKSITNMVVDLLHRTEYTIAGASLISSGVESVEFGIDQDGETRRGFIRLNVVYEF